MFPKEDNKERKVLSELMVIGGIDRFHEHLLKDEIGIWIHYNDRVSNIWTPQTYALLGFSRESIPPKLESVLPYVLPEDSEKLAKLISRINENQIIDYHTFTFKLKGPDGVGRELLLTAQSVEMQVTKELFWQGTIQDITQANVAYEGVKSISAGFFEMFKNLPLILFATDNQGNIVFWNNSCESQTGFKSSEIIGNRDAFRLIFPEQEQRKTVKTAIKELGSKSKILQSELNTKTGEQKLFKLKLFKSSSNLKGWSTLVTGYDISKLKNTNLLLEQKIEEFEILEKVTTDLNTASIDQNYYQLLGGLLDRNLKNCSFVIFSADCDAEFFTIEGVYGITSGKWQQALDVLGWNPIGRRFQQVQDIFRITNGNKLRKIEGSIYELTGGIVSSAASRGLERIFSFEDIYSVGMVYENTVLGGVIVLRQSAENNSDLAIVEGIINRASFAIYKKVREFKLQREKERAEEADRLKSGFLANLSHEIRTPMNAIMGFSQLLNLPNLNKEKRQQYIDIINSKGKMLVKIINDIIDVSKVESGELTIVKAPFKLNNLLRALKVFYDKEKVFQEREAIAINLKIPDNSDDFELVSDEGRIEQVMTNLIGNALKFTEKGSIEFGYTLGEKVLEFFVKDTGIGIAEDMHMLIFDRYRQVEEKQHRSEAGTGLGLAISKGIVELLEGKIWVESLPGDGANFRFTIPQGELIVNSDEDLSPHHEVNSNLPDWKNKVLLVAEDEDINYMYINEILTPTGVKTIWAKDGLQAVELVNTIKNINAILMDIKMPFKDGYAATMEIRQINPHIPIVAQTAYAYSEDRNKAEAAGCDDYITKPISSIDLYAILDKYLG